MRSIPIGFLCCFSLAIPSAAEQQFVYDRPHNLSQLAEEIAAAYPASRPSLQVYDHEGTIRIHVDDAIDMAGLDTLVASHVPQTRWPPPTADETELATLQSQLQALYDGLTNTQKASVQGKLLRMKLLERRLGR